MQMPQFMSEYEQIPPWKRKKPSLFFEDQLNRQSDIRDNPDATWYSNWPALIQRPMEWYKKQVLSGEARDERINKDIDKFVSNVGESMSERETRLEQERLKALAEKQELSQAQRRMPTTVDKSAIARKDDDDDDMVKYLLLINFLQSVASQSAAPDVKPGYGASVGTSRAFPTMPKMG
tara:strand:- start:978 stop:1511 length:534 start_codon:yes stop_codon:yes gene_type:complete